MVFRQYDFKNITCTGVGPETALTSLALIGAGMTVGSVMVAQARWEPSLQAKNLL